MVGWIGARYAALSPEALEHLKDVRDSSLRLSLQVTMCSYIVWIFLVGPIFFIDSAMVGFYATFPIASVGFLCTTWLISRDSGIAAWCFVSTALVGTTWAMYELGSVGILEVFVLVALATAVLIHPLGGLGVAMLSAILVHGVGHIILGIVHPVEIVRMIMFSILAVTAVYVTQRHLFLALDWYSASLSEARCKTEEANRHRAELVHSRKQLEIAHYRLEKANQALEAAWQAAREVEQEKTEFAATVSHEFRTPLNLIVGYSEMMMTRPKDYGDVPLPPAYRSDLAAVYRSAQHLLALADDVLDMAQMETSNLRIIREPVDLLQITRDAVALIRDHAEAKEVVIRLVVPPSPLPLMLLDRLRIRQVILNILVNAVRHTEAGGSISIKVERHDEYVAISIADTGSGMSPEDLSVVFRRYSRIGRKRPTHHHSAGLGAYISKQLIEMHGGDMGAESTLGVGTTFWFTLPIGETGSLDGAPHPTRVASMPKKQVNKTVVLASSDPRLARFLQRHLRGFHVEIAGNFEEAEAAAVEMYATAIVVDEEWAMKPVRSPVPVICCPLPQMAHSARQIGVSQYLVKPVSSETVLDAIRGLEKPVKNVLIVDDDPLFVRFLQRTLRTCEVSSYRIMSAYSASEGLMLAKDNRPDLILLDLSMPGMGGRELLRSLRTDAGSESIDVIAISGVQSEFGMPLPGNEIKISRRDGFCMPEMMHILSAALEQLVVTPDSRVQLS